MGTAVTEGIQTGLGQDLTVLGQDLEVGICGRTQEVQDAILATLSGVSDCTLVTDTHLSGIRYLRVRSEGNQHPQAW